MHGSRRNSKAWKLSPSLLCGGGVIITLTFLFFLQILLPSELQDDAYASIPSFDIIITNNYKHGISLFYDDHESGAFLATLHSKETVTLEAAPEQGGISTY